MNSSFPPNLKYYSLHLGFLPYSHLVEYAITFHSIKSCYKILILRKWFYTYTFSLINLISIIYLSKYFVLLQKIEVQHRIDKVQPSCRVKYDLKV